MESVFNEIVKEIHENENLSKVKDLSRFFKCGVGEYGEGDEFLGIIVPIQRKITKKYYKTLSLDEVEILLKNRYHEYRLIALFILVLKFGKGDDSEKQDIVNLYLKNKEFVNNWDLVDSSADKILGEYLINKSEDEKKILYGLAKSSSLWDRRISIIATFQFIKNGHFEDTLKISELLLNDKQDLIHKAVGWMLREVGNRNRAVEVEFLDKYYSVMPRTMLRYSIEKFDDETRKKYMRKV